MANLPYCVTVRRADRVLFIAITSARSYEDGFNGNHWRLYDEDGKLVSYGYSEGYQKSGMGSALMAEKTLKPLQSAT